MTASSASDARDQHLSVRMLGPGDESVLRTAAEGVFDFDADARLAAEFLVDPRHHIAVAIDADVIVGFASGVHYIHPDKAAELWVNEVGVAASYRGRGIGTRVVRALLDHGRSLGCAEAWVLTDRSNEPAMRLYASLGGTATDHVMVTFALDRP